MKKGMKSKGYAKGGAKMMKAKSGKMMKAMGGKMMKSKGYAKGGAKKVMTASMGMAAMKAFAKKNNMRLVPMDQDPKMKKKKKRTV